MNVEIKAGPFLIRVSGQDPAACAEFIYLIYEFDGVPYAKRRRIGSEEPEALFLFRPRVSLRSPGKEYPRVGLIHRDLDIGITLIVLQHGKDRRIIAV